MDAVPYRRNNHHLFNGSLLKAFLLTHLLPWWCARISQGTVCKPQTPASVGPEKYIFRNDIIDYLLQVFFGHKRLPSCSSIWEPPSLKGQSLNPIHQCCELPQSSPASSEFLLRFLYPVEECLCLWLCYVFEKYTPLDCTYYLFSLAPLNRCDYRSLSRPWFRRGRICSKTSHDTRHLDISRIINLKP